MAKTENQSESTTPAITDTTKLIAFTEGGKGGVGKTVLASLLLDWYKSNGVKVTPLDLDDENKSGGGLSYFHPEARKLSVAKRGALDVLVDEVDKGTASIIFADMGSRSGQVAFEWFDSMYEGVKELGVRFVAIGVVTADPASVASVIEWAGRLRNRVSYLIVLNELESPDEEFQYWNASEEVVKFRQLANPAVIRLRSILPDIQNAIRNHGFTLEGVASGTQQIPGKGSAARLRAKAILRSAFCEFDTIKATHLLP
jgi:hypothetical protein